MKLTPCPAPMNAQPHHQVETECGITVDEHALPVLDLLWSRGIETVCSCQGDTLAKCPDEDCLDEHEINGYVSVVGIQQAMEAYRELTEATGMFGGIDRICEDHRHTDDDEYAVWTPPMEQLAALFDEADGR